jgi:hypothetical protein
MYMKYKKLRGLMFENRTTQEDLAMIVNRSAFYVSERITGKKTFCMADVYKICDYLNIPYTDIHIYFPPDGMEGKA